MARKKSPAATPAEKRLRQLRIEHQVVEYEAALDSGAAVAEHLGVEAARVLKTLVVQEDPPRGNPWLVLVPSDAELDLKRFAAAAGLKRARMAPQKDAEAATGMRAGAISPIPLADRGFPVLVDALARNYEWVLVSAGLHGFEVRIAMDDLERVLAATVAVVTRPVREASVK